MSIQNDHTLNPVTALKFYGSSYSLILAGEGCYLKIFEASTSNFLGQSKIFEDQAIHGIAVRHGEPADLNKDEDLDVVVWGGSSLSVLSRKDITVLLRLSNRLESLKDSSTSGYGRTCAVSDWILDAAISPFKLDEFVLVTAHNTVLRANIRKESHQITLEALHSPPRPILYSARLIWESEDIVLVAAGTVFGEIIVWQCSVSTFGSRVLHTFTGHEGSIFGVDISPAVNDRDRKSTRLLASCSDDRTIRIWRLELGKEAGGREFHALVARETGFGDNVEGEASSTCLAMALGHASRIWSVEFLVKGSTISVMSFGEDATAQHWALDLEQSKLTHLNTFAYNTGKHVWSRTLLLNDESTKIATGGADGKISLFDIPHSASKVETLPLSPGQLQNGSVQQTATESWSWDLENILENLPSISNHSHNVNDSPQPVSEPGVQQVDNEFGCSPSLKNRKSSETMQATPIPDKTAKKPKSKSKKVPKDVMNRYAFVSESEVLITTTLGRILLGEIGSSINWKEIDMPKDDLRSYSVIQSIPAVGLAFLGAASGKIFSYQLGSEIQEFGNIDSKVADMFALYDIEKDTVELLATGLGTRVGTLFECSRDLCSGPKSFKQSERLVTLPERFVVTSAAKFQGRLLLGSRSGGLVLYDTEKYDIPICSWIPDNTGDAITTILNLSDPASNSNYFLTTSRDGRYCIFCLRFSSNISISLIHQAAPPFGPMIEAAWFSGGDLFLYGFKSKNFIVWNETRQCEVSSVECGGAHRSYAYSPRNGSNGAGYFIYTKASKLYLHSQSKPSHQIIKSGGHGREIKACAVSDDGLIATGAEDTAIRIWRYGEQFDCLAVVRKHTTGIQHLQWHGSNYLFSSGGNEEFFIWAVEPIPGFGVGVVCEASCPDQSEEKDLRIMSFDVSLLEGSNSPNESSLLFISLAYSDSTIKVYTYSKKDNFNLLAKNRYTSCCLTQLRHLEVQGNAVSLLTAATDGNLTIWKATISESHFSGATNRSIPEDDSAVDSSTDVEDSSLDRSVKFSGSLVNLLNEMNGSSIDPSNQLSFLSTHKVHQSSIKSLDIARIHNRVAVATGGDDNALAITVYDAIDTRPESTILRSAHAAAITGLSFVLKASAGELSIVTSGNDQRVKEWRIDASRLNRSEGLEDLTPNHSSKTNDSVGINKKGDVFTSIADVADLTTLMHSLGDKRVLVVGNGMEVYEVSMAT